jgi:hypothetical protein
MVMLSTEPDDTASLSSNVPVICVICRMSVEPYNVTAGSLYADGSQAFACSTHLRNRRTWFIVWTTFDNRQRLLRGGEVAR